MQSSLPLESTSPWNEWFVLLECASPIPNGENLTELIRSVDWPHLLGLAEDHGVTGHLAARLLQLNQDIVPPATRQALVEYQRMKIFFTLRMHAELFHPLDRFEAEKIGALVVKGPVLAIQAYGDRARRSYGDLDLLVRQRDIRRATELMIAAGYQAAVSLCAIDARKIPGQYLFSKPDSNLLVELHNDLTLPYFPRAPLGRILRAGNPRPPQCA
jgi:putative nucleotidyltransferase-like protein